MACFLVSAAEAAVVTAIEKAEEKKELARIEAGEDTKAVAIPMSRKLKWLSWMLWGGVILLAFEHVWHGEIVPFFPFLTAMGSQAETVEMLRELMTVGVSMAALITAVWVGVCFAADAIVRRPAKTAGKAV